MNDEKKAKWLRDRGWALSSDGADFYAPPLLYPEAHLRFTLDAAWRAQRTVDDAEARRVECDAFTRTLAAQYDPKDPNVATTDAEFAAKVARDWFRRRFGAPEGE